MKTFATLAFLALFAGANVSYAQVPAKASTSQARASDPSIAPVEDVAGLPRVLLIGDSISMGYTSPTRVLLKDKANVHRPPTKGAGQKS